MPGQELAGETRSPTILCYHTVGPHGSRYNFEQANVELLERRFEEDYAETMALLVLEQPNVYAAYDHLLKCSHTFNLLQARGAISASG